jgi:Leucine-rich repeat (LRR) protein
MAELQILKLFGNPLEFLPEILPLHKLRHLSLANMKIEADESLRSVNVQIEVVAIWQFNRPFLFLYVF